MKNNELFEKLKSLNINPKHFSILEKPKEYTVNLEYKNNKYYVFYLERGEQIYKKEFQNQEQANQYLFDMFKEQIDLGLDLS